MNPKPPQVLELLHKVKRLADQGHEGERVAASAALERLLGKHGMTTADLLGDGEPREVEFRCASEFEVGVLTQVVGCVTHVDRIKFARARRRRATVFFRLTPAQEADARIALAHFRPLLRAERRKLDARVKALRENFVSAFVMANEIYDRKDDPVERELTDEERKRLFEVMLQAADMDKKPFVKPVGLLQEVAA